MALISDILIYIIKSVDNVFLSDSIRGGMLEGIP